MSSYKFMDAMENMFDPEATVTSLLDAVRENVRSTVKTVDQACSLENKLSEEAAQFNNCLMTMSNAIRKCERGEISREEMLSDCAPCVDALKNKCVALTLANVKTVGDDITEDEIAMLREYIVGCKDIVADRKIELQDCSMASESYSAATEATASSVGKAIRQSTDAKTAAECYKQAKKLYGFGSKEEAKKYLAKAKKLYEKCLAAAKKHGKMENVTRESEAKLGGGITGFSYGKKDTYKKSVSMNGMGTVISYFEDRIDACTALQMQWDNKAGKSTFAETKAQLKAERKASQKAYNFNKYKASQGKKAGNAVSRSARKSANARYKEMMKSAAESWEEYEMIDSNFEFMESMESFVEDVLLDCELISAMESEGDPEGGKSEAEQKLEDLYVEFKKAKAAGNGPEMDRLTKEIQSVVNQVSKEAEDAVTEEDYAAAKRKQKKAIAVGAGVVATAAAIAAGVKTGAFKAVAEKARTTVNNMKEKKNDKAATAEGKSAINTVKTALSGIPGKFRNVFKKKGKGVEAAPESYLDDMTIEEFEYSMEAFMDSVEMDLAMEAAMESEGDESAEGAGKASGIGARLRAKFAKLKRAKKSGNESEVKAAADEVSEVIDEYAEAVDEAETPEEKKKLCKAAKVGIAAGATALIAAGVYAGGKKAAGFAEKWDAERASGAELNKAKSLLISAVNTVKNAKTAVKDKATEIGGKFAAKKLTEKFNNKDKEKKKFKLFGKKKANESFLSDLAFGLEGVMVDDEDVDDDEIDNLEGKAFDDDDMIDEATEAAIAVMMAEDGIDDSDLDFMF